MIVVFYYDSIRYDLLHRENKVFIVHVQFLSVRYGCFEIEEVTKKRGKKRIVTFLSSELCTPAMVKINACCFTIPFSHFVLLFQPLFVPCLFEKAY